MKKQVMIMAHAIKSHFKSFSQALKAAWKIIKINLGNPTLIAFAKNDGEVREAQAIATGSLSTIQKGYVKFVELLATGNTQWRSFRLERLILT